MPVVAAKVTDFEKNTAKRTCNSQSDTKSTSSVIFMKYVGIALQCF